MKKQFIYRGIRALCLLACLGLVWLGAGDGSLPGKTAGHEKKHTPREYGEALEEQIEQTLKNFSPWIDMVKVSWGPEELVDRMREKMEWWQEFSRVVTGYIQIFEDPPEHGILQGYGVIYEEDIHCTDRQYTFLLTDDGIYQIFSEVLGGMGVWRECMRKLLQNIPQWRITKEETKRYVHSFASDKNELYRSGYGTNRVSVWYDDMGFVFSELPECQSSVEETGDKRLRICFWNSAEEQEREMQICAVDMPTCDTYEEWREYLQTLHPELRSCYFFTYTAGEYCTDPFIMLEIEDMQYGYFQREGWWYQICFDIPGNGDYFDLELRKICSKTGYEYSIPSYWWRMDEKGNTIEADLMQDVYWLVEEISPGQIFSFECTMVRAQENDGWDEKVYRVAVTASGEEKPFQVFEVESSRGNGCGFSSWDFFYAFYFVDFNADGYRDLESLYYYGAHGGSAITFVWSPSQGEFVRMPEELGNWDRRVYPETRRFDVCYRDASFGEYELYQWSGEMDYELIRYCEYEYENVWDEENNLVGELYHEKIVAIDQGQEKVLADYTYDSEEDSTYNVHFLYDLDMIWEKKVAVTGQDKPCILRYAQDKAVIDRDGQEETYLDYLFLSREDTCLICTLRGQEAPAAYADIAWREEAEQLVVSYADGLQRCYQWDGAEFQVCADTLPQYETYRELREYMQTFYPDLRECEIYSYKDGECCENPVIALKTSEAGYGYFCREGQWSRVCIAPAENNNYKSLNQLRRDLGYDYLVSYRWSVTDEGNISEFDQEKWGNVKEVVNGAGNYDYYIREDGTVFSLMKYYYDGSGEPFAFIFPRANGADNGIQSYYWPEELDDIVILRDLSNKDICIIYYELKGIDDALMACADSYTVYLEKEDRTLWYWNSDRIKYHDNVLALTSPDSRQESRSGEFVRILTGDILETDDEEGTRIVSMCAGEENVLFLTEDGHVFASMYETYQVQDISYYRRSNPAPERLPSILTIEDMELKRLAFQQIPLTDIVSIGIDEKGEFYAIDQNNENFPVNIARK